MPHFWLLHPHPVQNDGSYRQDPTPYDRRLPAKAGHGSRPQRQQRELSYNGGRCQNTTDRSDRAGKPEPRHMRTIGHRQAARPKTDEKAPCEVEAKRVWPEADGTSGKKQDHGRNRHSPDAISVHQDQREWRGHTVKQHVQRDTDADRGRCPAKINRELRDKESGECGVRSGRHDGRYSGDQDAGSLMR